MPTTLVQLDNLKDQFTNRGAAKLLALLDRVIRQNIKDASSLIDLHELLLFIRAYPHNSAVLQKADEVLETLPTRLRTLEQQDIDVSSLEHPEVSGIAGSSVTDTFTFPIVRWLASEYPTQLSFYWEWFEDENRIGEVWPSVMPLLEEDTLVEANIPFTTWLRKAARGNEVQWLVEKLDQLELSQEQKAARYNAQKLYVQWRYNYRDSRTGLRGPVTKLFFHEGPLLSRRDVRLREELSKPPPELKKVSVSEGTKAIQLARLASTVRYRELYGFTNGDPKSVLQVDIGRGVVLQIISLPPDKRLPLRAYHSAMIYKNGVPNGYFEGLSLCDRMESGFNLYYTFRDGETAWLYIQILRVMRQLTGVSAFSLDPYQIGFENEEGIQSGAFWFYRKLGFRSTDVSIQELTEKEEQKIATRDQYRTSAATLRRLARAPMILELDETKNRDWDNFQTRNIGFALQRLMAEQFDGDATRLRTTALTRISDELGLGDLDYHLSDFAATLLLVPEIEKWTDAEKELLKRIIEAKCAGSEVTYLQLLQKHQRLRNDLIRLGSS